jgi:hypothetical protein
MDRATELIERYLDDIATAAERAELAALLAADPAVADALARATRVDARLRQLGCSGLEPQAPGRAAGIRAAPGRRSWKGWAAAAAVLLVLGGVLGGVLLVATRRPEPALQVVSGRLDGEALRTPLEVRGDAPAVIRLAGGARAELAPATRFVVHGPAEKQGPRIALLVGSGEFDVPAGSAALTVETPAGSVKGRSAAFAVRVGASESVTGRRDWQVTVAVAAGVVEVRRGEESTVLTSRESRTFRAARAPDVVGLVEGVSNVSRRQVVNGVEKALAETRLSLVVRGGPSAAKGSRLTVRLTESTRTTGMTSPAPGDVVRVWIAPGSVDLADYVEIAPPK